VTCARSWAHTRTAVHVSWRCAAEAITTAAAEPARTQVRFCKCAVSASHPLRCLYPRLTAPDLDLPKLATSGTRRESKRGSYHAQDFDRPADRRRSAHHGPGHAQRGTATGSETQPAPPSPWRKSVS